MATVTGKIYRGRKSLNDIYRQLGRIRRGLEARGEVNKATRERLNDIERRYTKNTRSSDRYQRVYQNGVENMPDSYRGANRPIIYKMMAGDRAANKAKIDASDRMGARKLSMTRNAVYARNRRAMGQNGG